MQPDKKPTEEQKGVHFDHLERRHTEEETRLQQEVDCIKQSYVEQFGEPDATANASR